MELESKPFGSEAPNLEVKKAFEDFLAGFESFKQSNDERLYGAEPEATPSYAPDWTLAGAETLRDGLARHLNAIPLAAMRPGDIALFRMAAGGAASHCGIVGTRDGAPSLIHARQNRRVREEPFSAFWRTRLAYVFRARHDLPPAAG